MTTGHPDTVIHHLTLHLEVRSRGSKPGTSNKQVQVWTCDLEGHASDRSVLLVHNYGFGGNQMQSSRKFDFHEYDEATNQATLRYSVPASDKLVSDLPKYGWVRRTDLEEVANGE